MVTVTAGQAPAQEPYRQWSVRYPNRKAMGYLCTLVPEEIIHAAGFATMRIVPGVEPATRADAHLQSYTCCLARSCLHQALAGKLDFLSGVVFAHTCDTMQGLADIWREAFPNLFVDTVVLPVTLDSPYAKSYLVAELKRLIQSLEQRFDVEITEERLSASIALYNARRRGLAEFYAHRQEYSICDWFSLMDAALVTPVEEKLFAPKPLGSRGANVRVALIGATLDEPALPQILDELGAAVVADDLCTGARYLPVAAEDMDPIQALAERELRRQPCPCKHRHLDTRRDHLLNMVRDNAVQGVIFNLKKFCDPHAWDYVPLKEALDQAGIPHLLLETDQVTAMGPTRVRVEAFLEMLS